MKASGTVSVPSGLKNEHIAKRIAKISKYMIPGFDVNESGDYVVTGLKDSKIPALDGTNDSDKVFTSKDSQLLGH